MLVMLTSCANDILEVFGGSGEATDGVPVTLTFEAAFPGGGAPTRSVNSITNLTLLVFNEEHRYLYRAKATLEEIVDAPIGVTFLPDGVKEKPVGDKLYRFSVRLMTSSKPRIIHFVADYDNLDAVMGDDLDHQGADEGEVVPPILSKDTDDFTYWQVFHFNNIEENSFKNKAFELLRDKARITVLNDPNSGFDLKGFSIHNAPNCGTIASYQSKLQLDPADPRAFYRDVMYTFPIDPTRPTVPANIELIKKGATQSNLNPINIFEYSNTEAGPTKQLSIVLYGKRSVDTDYSYYKLDMVQDIYADADKKIFVGTQHVDIVRNFNYIIKITSSNGTGYPTYDEAVRNPGSNNLFGSVELQDYGDVTDGEYTLVVDNTNAVMTLPGQFLSQISFSGKGLSNPPSQDVRVFLNTHECDGDIQGDPYIDYAKYDRNTGVLNVNVKDIPTDADQHYTFNVVGTPPDKPQTHIQRTITLTLRKRYNFNLRLEEKDPIYRKQGSEVDLTFTIPGTLPSTLFPFDIYIAADQLSPLVNAQYNDQMKVLKVGKRTFYVYTVRTSSSTNQDVTLHFQRTHTNGSCDVTFASTYFNNTDVVLPNNQSTSTDTRGKLSYSGLSYTVPKIVPSAYRTKLQVTGAAGVTATMASAGYVEFSGLENANGGDHLTLTADMNLGNGTVKATKTLTVNEWKQSLANKTTMDLNISEVVLEGALKYQRNIGGTYEPVPKDPRYIFSVTTTEPSIRDAITMEVTSNGFYRMRVTHLETIKKPVSFAFHLLDSYTGLSYESNSTYISKLFDNPSINLTTH